MSPMDRQPTPEELQEERAFQEWRAEERLRMRRIRYRIEVVACSLLVVFLSSLLVAGVGFSLLASVLVSAPLAICLWLRLDQLPTLCIVGPVIFWVNWPYLFLILMQVVLISFVARFYALRLDQ